MNPSIWRNKQTNQPENYFLHSRTTAAEPKSLKFHLSDKDHSSSEGRKCCMGLDNF